MQQGSIARIATLSTLLLAGAVGGQARASITSPTDEPITIAIAVGLGTGLAVTLAYDQATANFISTAFAYAKPDPDADVGWYLGRGGYALAMDYDSRSATRPESWAKCTAQVNWILPDSLDPKHNSFGAYHNVARTFKNGSLRNAQSGGQPDPNDGVNKVNVDINGFTSNSGRMKISVTGGTGGGGNDSPGSRNAVYAMGAEFNEVTNMWLPWLPNQSGLESAVSDYYNASNGGAASISDIAMAAAEQGCLNFSSMLAGALNGVTSVVGSQVTVGSLSLTCDLTGGRDTVFSSALNWWQSVQAEANADAFIPTPGAATLLALAGACFASPRRR